MQATCILTLGDALVRQERRVCEADWDPVFQDFMNRRGIENRRGPQNEASRT